MKILILNPGSKFTKNVIRDVVYGCWCKGRRIGGAKIPPFTLMQIASILDKDTNNQVFFIDAAGENISFDQIKNIIHNYDIVIMSTSTMSFFEDAEYLLTLKKSNIKLKTIIFGSHPTFMPEFCLQNDGVDFIIKHDPEFVVRDFITALNRKMDWRQIKGIGYKENGKIIVNEHYPFFNLDQLPFINLKFLSVKTDYFNPLIKRSPYIAISTSRGCPGKCTFCTAPYFEGNYIRFQSAGYVLEELKHFRENGIREIYFRDETFFVDKERDKDILKSLIAKKIDLTWLANARIGLIDEDTIKLAKDAGCHTIKFGVESGNQDLLNKMRKGYKKERAIQIFDFCNKIGIKTHAHVMIGVPGETEETVKETISFVKRLNPTTASFGICTPYPGSSLFEEMTKKCPTIISSIKTNLKNLHQDAYYNQYYTDLSAKRIEKYVNIAYRKFYLRVGKFIDIWKKNIKSIDDLKKISKATINILKFIIYGE